MVKVESFQGADANEVARAITGFLAVPGRVFKQLVVGSYDRSYNQVVYVVYEEQNIEN